MSKGPWMRIDPEVDLKGATPETLAAALLRNRLRLGWKDPKKDGAPPAIAKRSAEPKSGAGGAQ